LPGEYFSPRLGQSSAEFSTKGENIMFRQLKRMVLLGAIACSGCQSPRTSGDPMHMENVPDPHVNQTSQPAAPTFNVAIDNFSFSPAELTVPLGAKVIWINRDDVPHTIVSTDKAFKSAALDTDETFSHVFKTAGTFPYFCSVHPHMTGRVIVK
jgi:plastocyanin